MRIVIVEGLWRYDDRLAHALSAGMKEQFPKATIIPEYLIGCWPYEVARMRLFIERLANKYDDGIETLFMGHSMGGIFACALESRLRNTRIVGIITICSPHVHSIFPHVLDGAGRLEAPIITFEARHDTLVWWGSHHPQSLEHIVLDSDHRVGLIRDLQHVRRIAETAHNRFA